MRSSTAFGFRPLVVAIILGSGAGTTVWASGALPTRAIAFEGGLIAVEGGVMRDPSRTAGIVGKMRYPTIYFVNLRNETAAPVWAEVSLNVPGKKPKSDFGLVKAGGDSLWRWPAYDAEWDTAIPIEISVYADEARARELATRRMNLYFDASEKELLHKPPQVAGGKTTTVLISGWHEMDLSRCAVEGSAADRALQSDVCLSLWKNESIGHLDCDHQIVRAEPLAADQSALLAAQPEDFRTSAEAFRSRGALIMEKWTVKSCEVETPYEVMLIKAPQGGTDIMVKAAAPAVETQPIEKNP
jgi:hypothetical protein